MGVVQDPASADTSDFECKPYPTRKTGKQACRKETTLFGLRGEIEVSYCRGKSITTAFSTTFSSDPERWDFYDPIFAADPVKQATAAWLRFLQSLQADGWSAKGKAIDASGRIFPNRSVAVVLVDDSKHERVLRVLCDGDNCHLDLVAGDVNDRRCLWGRIMSSARPINE